MSDKRSVSGSIEIEHEGRFLTAFKLMEAIGGHEFNNQQDAQRSRDYWLKLYVQCVDATFRHLPEHLKK